MWSKVFPLNNLNDTEKCGGGGGVCVLVQIRLAATFLYTYTLSRRLVEYIQKRNKNFLTLTLSLSRFGFLRFVRLL